MIKRFLRFLAGCGLIGALLILFVGVGLYVSNEAYKSTSDRINEASNNNS